MTFVNLIFHFRYLNMIDRTLALFQRVSEFERLNIKRGTEYI